MIEEEARLAAHRGLNLNNVAKPRKRMVANEPQHPNENVHGFIDDRVVYWNAIAAHVRETAALRATDSGVWIPE